MAEVYTPVNGITIDNASSYEFEDEVQPASYEFMNTPDPSPISDGLAEQRAKKYDYALGTKSPGTDILKYGIQSGTELEQRQRQINIQRVEDQEVKLSILREYAAQSGGMANLTPEDVDMIMTAEPEDLKDPNTFFEKQYSKKMWADVTALDTDVETTDVDGTTFDDGSLLGGSMAEDQEGTMQVMDAAERIMANAEFDNRILQDFKARQAKESWASRAGDFAESMIPGHMWYRMSDADGVALLGNDLEEQYARINQMPTTERAAFITAKAEELYAINSDYAIAFLDGLQRYTGTEKFLNNAISLTDASMAVPGIGLLPLKPTVGAAVRAATGPGQAIKAVGAKAGSQLEKMQNMVKSVVKTASNPMSTPAAIVSATGNTKKAGLMIVLERMAKAAKETGTLKAFVDFTEPVPAVANPGAMVADRGWASQRYADQLAETLAANASEVLKATYLDASIAARLDSDSITQMAGSNAVKDLMNTTFGKQADVVIDVKPVSVESTLGKSSNFVEVTLGNKNTELFDDSLTANNVAKEFYGITDVHVVPVGGKYAIGLRIPVDETKISVREEMMKETAGETPKSIGTMFLSYLRSAEDRVSKRVSEEAKSALMGGGELSALAKQLFGNINKVSNKSYRDLNRFMEFQRDFKPKGGERGVFSNTLAQFGVDWQNFHRRLPTEAEATAYFTARQLNDLGWIGTNMGLYRDKTRMGLQMFHFGKHGKPSVEGRFAEADDLFRLKEDTGFVVIGGDPADIVTYRTKYLGKRQDGSAGLTEAEIRKMIDSGEYKIMQISRTGQEALRAMYPEELAGKYRLNFVVTKNFKQAPLDFKQIPYRPGGHVELDDGYFLRQAIITESTFDKAKIHTYSGDRNLFHFVSKKDGERIAKNMDHARKLYMEGTVGGNKLKLAELKHFLATKGSNIPYSYTDFVRLFKGKNAKYDVKQPLYLTRKNESIEGAHKISKNYANWENAADDPYDLYRGGINLQWASERGDELKTVINSGSTNAPDFHLDKARHIDAITTLENATNGIIRDPYMSNYKHVASERFIAEFGDVLDVPTEDLRANPFKALIDGKFKEGTKDNRDLLSAAKASRRATLEFLGTKDEFTRNWDYTRAKLWQKLVDSKGEKEAHLALDRLDFWDGWTYGAIKNPLTAMRAFAFHTKLGLFNPVQMFLQAQTMVHIVGVAGPVNGGKSVAATPFIQAAMLAPQHADAILAKAGVFGWKPGQLKEAMEAAKSTGWYRVGKEVAVRDDFINAPLTESRLGKVAETGTVFFREGERATRIAAWNAAYLEWRAANPTKALDNLAKRKILARADLFSVNMTAASNAAWQKGFASVPFQFFGYQQRLMEQFLGKRLTRAEKLQAFSTYGAVYGLPVSLGTYTGVLWPAHESIKEELLNRGIDTNDNLVFKTMHDGLLSMIVEEVVGEKMNVGERYGPGGMPFLKDLLSGEKSVMESLAGVSGTSIWDTVKSFEPFTFAIASALDPESEIYTPTSEDIMGILRNASTGKSLDDMMTAMNIGKYISKNGTQVDDMTGFEAAMKALAGLTPERIPEMYRMMQNNKDLAKYHEKGRKKAVTEMRKAFNRGLSPEEQQEHLKRAFHIMHVEYGLPLDQVSRVWSDASKGYETLVESIGWEWAQKSPEHMELYNKKVIEKNN